MDDCPGQAWFAPALELLTYATGWSRLDLGVYRWRKEGKALDDDALTLVAEMLGDRLDELVAWIASSHLARQLEYSVADVAGEPKPDVPRVSEKMEQWAAELSRGFTTGLWSPYGEDGDPMHLAAHATDPLGYSPGGGPQTKQRPPLLLTSTTEDRRAVLHLDTYTGWYRHLATLGRQLPSLANNRSWRVDVVCHPVGHLGTFRRSRLTGRWFRGRHRTHRLGWPA